VTAEETANQSIIFTENSVAYALRKHRADSSGQLFFKFHHNLSSRGGRTWYYYCAPEVDVIEVGNQGQLIAYELKGVRRHRSGTDYLPCIL
jgi:hypothetical protein